MSEKYIVSEEITKKDISRMHEDIQMQMIRKTILKCFGGSRGEAIIHAVDEGTATVMSFDIDPMIVEIRKVGCKILNIEVVEKDSEVGINIGGEDLQSIYVTVFDGYSDILNYLYECDLTNKWVVS